MFTGQPTHRSVVRGDDLSADGDSHKCAEGCIELSQQQAAGLRKAAEASVALGQRQRQFHRPVESALAAYLYGSYDAMVDECMQLRVLFSKSLGQGWVHSVDVFAYALGLRVPGGILRWHCARRSGLRLRDAVYDRRHMHAGRARAVRCVPQPG